MINYPVYECKTIEQVKDATTKLDKASMLPLKIDDGGVLKDVEKFKGIYNISKGKFCSAVVSHYNLIQHKEYFDGFAEALKRLNLKFKMDIKQCGNKAFADISFINKNIKFDKLNEEFITGIRLINSYDKSTGLHAVPRFTRLACTNGMIITRNDKTLSVKHHSKILEDIQRFIEKRINDIIGCNGELQVWVSSSIKDSIEWETCCKIISKLFTQIKHREEILKRLGISVIVVKDKKTNKKAVSYVWNDDKQKKKKISRWELYNAITNYLTYGEHITPHIENIFHRYAEKLLITPLIEMPITVGI